MKRGNRAMALILAGVMILGLAGCSQETENQGESEAAGTSAAAETEGSEVQEESLHFTAGTYTGTAAGLSGTVTVEVTFSEEAITAIQVGENNETAYLMKTVSQVVPERILEAQSLAVDTVTGATYASRGVINAVADCVEQAGGDVDAMTAVPVRETTSETVDVDVVVVGAGLAGLMTAAVLKESGVDNVLLIEMQGVTGGSGVFSAGQMYGSIEDGEHMDYVRETFMELTMDFPASEETENYPNMDKVDVLIQEGHETFAYFAAKGLGLQYTDLTFLDSPADTRVFITNPEAEAAGITSAGETLVWTLQKAYEDLGGEIRLETTATDLIVDETGAVAGVHAATQTGDLTINAKYTVICTGSAGRNAEVLAEYMPSMADGEVRVLSMGSDGSGIRMMADIGADVYSGWIAATAGVFSINPMSQLSNNSQNINIVNTSELMVDYLGIRRCAEFTERNNTYYYQTVGVEDSVYCILDQGLVDQLELQEKMDQGLEQYPSRFFRADTLEELAELAGLPADTLAETVATYNGYCETGVDADFGKSAEELIAIDEAPYYCVRYSITGKDIAGGVVSNTKCQVLDTEGNVIEGLYACGFASNRDYYGTALVGSVGLQTAVTGGRLAAEDIAAKLQ